jgi:hypothetical protein
MRNPNSQAGSGLGHPFFWAALALLLLNDHILKGAHVLPGVLTGKLSDFAGLIVAPVVLAALLRVRGRTGRMMVLAGVAAVFGGVKLSRPMADALERLTTYTPWPWRIWCDPTDLVALSVLPLTWWLMARQSGPTTGPRVRLLACVRAAGLVLGTFACAATQPAPGDQVGTIFLLNGTTETQSLRLSRLVSPLDCARNLDDPAQRPGADAFVLQSCPALASGEILPLDQVWTNRDASAPPSYDPWTGRPTCDAVLLQAEGLDPVVITWSGLKSIETDKGEFADRAESEQGLILERAGERLFIQGTTLVYVQPAGFEPAPTDCPNGER